MNDTSPSSCPGPLRPPTFRLRTLLVGVTVCCIFLALLLSLNPYGVFAAILAALALIAHFLGAMLGHRLQDHGTQTRVHTVQKSPLDKPAPDQFAPVTRLSQRRAASRWLWLMTVIWAVLGAIAGAGLLLYVNGPRSTPLNLSLGAIAFFVLGGLWGFAITSFLQETVGAFWQARK